MGSARALERTLGNWVLPGEAEKKSLEPDRRSEEARWFKEEVEPHTGSVKSWLCRTYAPLREEADDIVQEALVRLLQIQAKSPIACPRTYLYGVARKVALEFLRRQRRQHQIFTSEPVSDLTESRSIEPAADVVAIVSRAQEATIVAQAVKTLPDRCREIIMLRLTEGLTSRQIAARLGLAEPTVRVQICRGIQHCAGYFEEMNAVGGKTP